MLMPWFFRKWDLLTWSFLLAFSVVYCRRAADRSNTSWSGSVCGIVRGSVSVCTQKTRQKERMSKKERSRKKEGKKRLHIWIHFRYIYIKMYIIYGFNCSFVQLILFLVVFSISFWITTETNNTKETFQKLRLCACTHMPYLQTRWLVSLLCQKWRNGEGGRERIQKHW